MSESQLEAIKFKLFIHLIFSIYNVKDSQRKVMNIAAYFINWFFDRIAWSYEIWDDVSKKINMLTLKIVNFSIQKTSNIDVTFWRKSKSSHIYNNNGLGHSWLGCFLDTWRYSIRSEESNKNNIFVSAHAYTSGRTGFNLENAPLAGNLVPSSASRSSSKVSLLRAQGPCWSSQVVRKKTFTLTSTIKSLLWTSTTWNNTRRPGEMTMMTMVRTTTKLALRLPCGQCKHHPWPPRAVRIAHLAR